MIGAEGQYYWGNTTFYSQVGYFDADDETEGDVMENAWFFRQQIRHFLTGHDRAQLGFSYASGEELSGSDDYEFWTWEARYDHQFPDTPLSVLVGYKGLRGKQDAVGTADEKLTEHVLFFGIGFTFGFDGKMDLLANDRRGATFDLPDVGRMTGYTLEVLD